MKRFEYVNIMSELRLETEPVHTRTTKNTQNAKQLFIVARNMKNDDDHSTNDSDD